HIPILIRLAREKKRINAFDLTGPPKWMICRQASKITRHCVTDCHPLSLCRPVSRPDSLPRQKRRGESSQTRSVSSNCDLSVSLMVVGAEDQQGCEDQPSRKEAGHPRWKTLCSPDRAKTGQTQAPDDSEADSQSRSIGR